MTAGLWLAPTARGMTMKGQRGEMLMRIPADDFAENLAGCFSKIRMLRLMGFDAQYDVNTNSVHVYWIRRGIGCTDMEASFSRNSLMF